MKSRFTLLLLLITLYNLHAQSIFESQNAKSNFNIYSLRIDSFSRSYPQEKVYLHFDNTAYYQGETIWFKAYIVRADRNSLSEMSKVLYVELVSADGNSVETKKYNIENGQCHGDFKLPTINFAGFYEVRAYTRYMLNFGEDNYFSRVFPVYDQPKYEGEYSPVVSKRPFSQRIPQIRPEYNQKGSLALSFYPEGGNLVIGLTSKLAFKAIGKDGENAFVSGIVTDPNGQQVGEFSSSYLGMGMFELTPQAGRYKAKVEYQGQEYSFDLPSAMPSGYILTMENGDPDKIYVRVRRNPNTVGQILGIAFSCRGIIYASDQMDLVRDTLVELSVPKRMLPSGVVQATLYTSEGAPLCERLCFVNHSTQMKIGFSQDKSTYQALEPVKMDFELKDFKGNPVETTFSLAVRDASTCRTNPYDDNILTNLLLSSELKGYIENPGYYFKSDSPSLKTALDLLMMTQGWSRYDWKQMAGGVPFSIKHPVEKGLLMEGSVLSLWKKKKLENIDLNMILMSDSTSQRGHCVTDKEGKFNFALKDFEGQGKLILETRQKGKRKEQNIVLDRNFSPPLRSYAYQELHLQNYIQAERNDSLVTDSLITKAENELASIDDKKLPMEKKNHLLKEVIVKGKKKERSPIKISLEYKVEQEMDKIKDSGGWEPSEVLGLFGKLNKYFVYGGPKGPLYKGNKKVIFIKDSSSGIALDLDGLLSGSNGGGNESNSVDPMSNNNYEDEFSKRNELPNLDEIESLVVIEDGGDILRLCPNLINNENLKNHQLVVVVMRLKKRYVREPFGIRNTYFQGFAPQRQFYNPNYEHAPLPDKKDYRRTLYWNPDVKTDASGKATVSFYNNATCKLMNVSAETVTENGVMGALCK